MKRIVATLALICACHASFAETYGDWEYSVSNGEATITGYTGAGGAVTIPSEVNGILVKKLKSGSWPSVLGIQNSSVTSVSIPNSVTDIGDAAFSQCVALTSVTIPDSVMNIGDFAFDNCAGLASATLGGGVTNIGRRSFGGCYSLANLTIPNGVTSIGVGSFQYCYSLTSVTIPNSVTSIGNEAFIQCTGLTNVIIGSGVTMIGDGAFSGTPNLTSLSMPDKFISQVYRLGLHTTAATDYIIQALANNDAFVTAVANKIKATGGNYGIATQSGLSSAIEPLATKTQITTAINEGRAAGIASVTASPNTWSLFTSSQIQNMAIGDLVLTREVNGNFVLNYDIEQSDDLANWTVYSANTQIVRLPADKAFVRIKAKQ